MHAFKGVTSVGYHASSQVNLRTALVARTHFARFHDWEVTMNPNAVFDPTSGQTAPESVALGNYDVQFRGVLEGTTEGPIVPLLGSVLGGTPDTTTVGTTGKQHVIPHADVLPSRGRLSMESKWGTSARALLYAGVAKRVRYNAMQAGYAQWEVEGVGSSPARTESPTAATLPAIATLLSQRKSTFTLDGVATRSVRGYNWEVSRAVDEDDYDVGSHQRRDAEYGELTVNFDAEVTFEDDTDIRRFWGGAALTGPSDTEAYYPLTIQSERYDVIPGGTAVHTAKLTAPKVFLTGCSTPQRGRDQIRQRIQGRAIYDAATSKACDVTLINTVAEY